MFSMIGHGGYSFREDQDLVKSQKKSHGDFQSRRAPVAVRGWTCATRLPVAPVGGDLVGRYALW